MSIEIYPFFPTYSTKYIRKKKFADMKTNSNKQRRTRLNSLEWCVCPSTGCPSETLESNEY